MTNSRIVTTTPESQSKFERFFYTTEVPYGLAIVRILLPIVLLFGVVVPRWQHARELYSTDGAAAQLAKNFGFHDFLPEPSGAMAVALISILAFTFLTSSIGWFTRFSLCVSTAIYFYLNMLDSLSSITKYSAIATHALFLLSISRCGDVWSIDAWLKQRRAATLSHGFKAAAPKSPAWQRRLMQLMIAVVYFSAGFTKFHTPEYFSGDQLRYWMMTNVNNPNPMGEYLSLYPWVLVVFAYIAVIWEVLFIFLAWGGWGRFWMLTIGIIFHIMTTITLGLYVFPPVCISIYFAFVDESDVMRATRFMRRLQRRMGLVKQQAAQSVGRFANWPIPSRWASASAFSIGFVVVVTGGIAAEHALDPYGVRRPEGPYELVELSDELADKMLAATTRIRPQDKVLAFEIGTQTMGGVLMNRKYDYIQGECALVECSLNPPHEDLWIECNLHDHEDHMMERVGSFAAREHFRSYFTYTFNDSISPGDYFLVMKIGGTEVARRQVKVRPRLNSPVAN